MQTLIVNVEGLLLPHSSTIPNADPLSNGVKFFRRFANYQDPVILVTEHATPQSLNGWLTNYGIYSHSAVAVVSAGDVQRRADDVMSYVGARHSSVSLFVGARMQDVVEMARRGIPSVWFAQPIDDDRRQQKFGSSWSENYDPDLHTPLGWNDPEPEEIEP